MKPLHHLEARHGDHFDHRGRGKTSALFKDYLVQVGIDRVRAIHARPGDQTIVYDNAIAERNLRDDVAAAGVIDGDALISKISVTKSPKPVAA